MWGRVHAAFREQPQNYGIKSVREGELYVVGNESKAGYSLPNKHFSAPARSEVGVGCLGHQGGHGGHDPAVIRGGGPAPPSTKQKY